MPRLAAALHRPSLVWILLASLLAGAAAGAPPEPAGDQLQLAIILTRHGVRSPLHNNEFLAAFAAQPWPKWEVEPGIQTPHGNQLIALMGDYYRARFTNDGILTGDPGKDGPAVFIRADNDQRTIETGRILGRGLVPNSEPDVHALPSGTFDPLFAPVKAHIGQADTALASAAVLGRMGGDPKTVERAYATQLGKLEAIVYGPGQTLPTSSPFNAGTVIAPGEYDNVVKLTGPFYAALQCTEALILEYADGKPMADVGWGRVDSGAMTDLLALHELYFDLTARTRYPAQVQCSNLASHIIDTLEQAAAGSEVPGALGPAGEKIVVIVGHDTNIANLGGLFGLNWWLPGTQMDPLLPGGALVFELWKRGGQPNAFYVRTSYVAQTLEQQREASVLSLDHPPGRSPIFVPGASGSGPGYDAPLAAFVRMARRVIDPAFIAPEL